MNKNQGGNIMAASAVPYPEKYETLLSEVTHNGKVNWEKLIALVLENKSGDYTLDWAIYALSVKGFLIPESETPGKTVFGFFAQTDMYKIGIKSKTYFPTEEAVLGFASAYADACRQFENWNGIVCIEKIVFGPKKIFNGKKNGGTQSKLSV